MFAGVAGPAVGVAALFLWAGAIYAIRKGRILRKQYPLVLPASERRAARRSYLLIVLIEFLALVSVLILANRIHRPDLGVDWFAMLVGLHFLPLAKTFRAPALGIFGILIALWCLLCWGLFRSNALAISAALGTGILLWTMTGFALFRARKIAHALGEA